MSEENPVVELEETPVQVDEQASVEAQQVEPEAKPVEEPPTSEEEPKKNGVQKRIDELVGQRNQAQQEVERLKSIIGDEPVLKGFDSYEDYVAAKTIRKMHEQQAEQANAQAEQIKQAIVMESFKQYDAKAEEARKVYDDFDQVTRNPNLPISNEMAEFIRIHPKGPDIAYQLGKNPAQAAQIANASPALVGALMSDIASNLTVQPKITSAPDPTPPVGGNDTPAVDTAKMTTKQWMEWRNAQLNR